MVANPARPKAQLVAPRHVAVIMDGNGRWARRRALPRQAGHQAGIKPVRATVELCAEAGVETLTLFAFSSENWRRPVDEVRGLMSLFVDALEREVDELDANGIRMKFIGDLDALNPTLRRATDAAVERTKAIRAWISSSRSPTAVAGTSPGPRASSPRKRRRAGSTRARSTRRSSRPRSRPPASPSVDLLIRTGGEKRISNFLLWDIAYAEVFFSDVLWPDFTAAELRKAFEFYARRQRRFGRTGEQIEVVG